MTTSAKSYRFRIANAGATAVAGNVFHTETGNVADVGEVGGQRVSPLRAKTTAKPWAVEIADVAETITAILADSDGRAHLLRRLCDIAVSTDDGSTWTVLATGRIQDVEMVDVAAFRFRVSTERLIERETEIFTDGNTTWLAPEGIENAWLDLPAGSQRRHSGFVEVESVDGTNNTTTYRSTNMILQDAGLELVKDDVVDDPADHDGNFRRLRANIDGTNRLVATLGGSPGVVPVKNLEERNDHQVVRFTVSGYQDPGGVGAVYPGYLHMQSRDPSEELPLHIGGSEGIDPFTLVKDIYDGSYQDTNPATVRYDSSVFSAYHPTNNPDGLIDHPRFPKMHFRITGPAQMDRWLEDNIYGPLGVTPVLNAAGEVAPKLSRLPASDQVPNPDNLFEFNKSNSSAPHPGWHNRGRDQVTVLKVRFEYAQMPDFETVRVEPPSHEAGEIQRRLIAPGTMDLLRERETTHTLMHDKVDDFGSIVHEVTMRGIHRRQVRGQYSIPLSKDLFERFGDGPILTEIHGLAGTESVVAGDWVVLNLDSYPSLQNQSRSGKRLLQILARYDAPAGPRFEAIELGPSSQPLGAPSVSVAANSNNPNNAVDITVSSLPSGASYRVDIAVAASEPAEESPDWQYRTLAGDQNETVTARDLPAGETIWVRVRSAAPGRISSDWSTADSQATTALTAPSGLSSSDVTADAATISWTNGESDYGILVDLGGDAEVFLQPGTTEYKIVGLSASTSYTVGIRHADAFGGESSRVTTGVNTGATAETLPAMNGIRILVGGTA